MRESQPCQQGLAAAAAATTAAVSNVCITDGYRNHAEIEHALATQIRKERSFHVPDLPNVVSILQVLMSEFEGWASVQGDREIAFDWDDAAGNTARREAGLKLEKLRNAEIK